MTSPSGHILDYPAERRGKLRRAVAARVRYRPAGKVQEQTLTAPKGTPVAHIAGSWWIADLDWLEQLVPGGRTSVVYHGARHYGIEVPGSEVVAAR
jgi:hypothetical protein